MRNVPTSGGIELGPHEGPWIDIVPLAPVKDRGEALLALASRLVRMPGHWSAWEGSRRPLLPASPELQGVTGILGEQPILMVMFRWWQWQTPAQAIVIIEQAESRLPLGLACACLAAARAGRSLRRAPGLMATVAETIYGQAVTPSRFPRGDEVEKMAHTLMEAIAAGAAPPDPGSASAVARALMRISRLLWHEDGARLSRRAWRSHGRWDLLEQLAAAGAELWGIERVAWGRSQLTVPSGHEARAWTAFAEAVGTGLPDRAWRHLVGTRSLSLDSDFPGARAAPDPDTCLSFARALLGEASAKTRYVLEGGYRVIVPRDVAQAYGLRQILIWAERRLLWASFLRPDSAVTAPCSWDTATGELGPPVPPEAAPAVALLLSALWLDLVVGGEEATPARSRLPVSPAGHLPPSGQNASATARPLPSPVRPRPMERRLRVWASAADRRAIRKAVTLVRGHLRRLREGQHPSASARAAASSYGIVLPPGHTFVRPHARGGTAFAARPVAARGLASLLALTR
jgi:hypothetical protein